MMEPVRRRAPLRISIPASSAFCSLCRDGEGVINLLTVSSDPGRWKSRFLCMACCEIVAEAVACFAEQKPEVVIHQPE